VRAGMEVASNAVQHREEAGILLSVNRLLRHFDIWTHSSTAHVALNPRESKLKTTSAVYGSGLDFRRT
jgi:hypothetical protein